MAADPGFDARLQSALEELAGYVNYTTVRQPDGSLTVLLGGQTPLVIGDRQYDIETGFSSAGAALYDADGRDITAQVVRGRLGALLESRNQMLPSFIDDLDQLAASLADRVNAVLAAGVDLNGQPGAPLFAYDPAGSAAASLSLASILPEQLAGALASAPGGNGNVLELMGLVDSAEIDGASFIEYYGALARNIGRAVETAREDLKTNEQLLLQARALRDDVSGVSLDEEAVRLIEFQRAYQASARLVTVLNDLTEVTINLIR
jgi:flagellar hook-associated protein 1 FlgK